MKIAVIGPGAMGTIFAAHLEGVAESLTLVGRSGAQLEALRAQGLTLDGPGGQTHHRLHVADRLPAAPVDLIVLAVKATQVEALAPAIAAAMGPDTLVLALQNGVGSAGLLARHVDPDRMMIGIAAAFGAEILAPGHTRHASMEAVRMGPYAGLDLARAEAVAALWRQAGFNAEAVANIASMQWEKLICNVSFSAPCGLSGLTVGEAFADPDIGPVCRAAGEEAWRVAKAAGVAISVTDPIAHITAFAGRVATARPSLLQDLTAGRSSEIDFINGGVCRTAAAMGMDAPVNATLVALVRRMERARAGT